MLNEPSDLAVAGLVAEKFAEADAARMEQLNRLCRRKPKDLPVEDVMPKGRLSTARTCCDSKGRRHLRTCPEHQAGGPGEGAGRERERERSDPRPGEGHFDVQQASVEYLLAVRGSITAELERRRELLKAQLDEVAEALGEGTA